MKVNVQSIVDKILHVSTPPPLPANNKTLEKKLDHNKSDIESMVEKVLQAFTNLKVGASLGLLIT